MRGLYLVSYIALLSIAIGVLYIFKPYEYVDNATSMIICNKDTRSFETGWNFIYSFDGKLDSFNDTKARKLCEYNSIKDYGNSLKTPLIVNYKLEPKYIQESSWADALLMFFATFIFGVIVIQFLFSKLNFKIIPTFLLVFLITSPIVFFALIKKPAGEIYCKRQIARKVNNFKRIIFKYGIFPIPEEDSHIKKLLPNLYQSCLTNEGIKK